MKRGVAFASMLLAWMLMMVVVVHSAPADAVGTDFEFKDKFETGGYNGNDGDHDFTGPWWEMNDWGGANHGFVTVESGGDCPNDRCAVIAGDPFLFLVGTGLIRYADLDGAATATLKFKYSVDVHESSTGYLDVAVYDGNRWHVVKRLALIDYVDDDDGNVRSKTIDVTQYASDEFMVGFFAHDDWHAIFHLDDVKVYGTWAAGATTTTTTTTITLPPVTTTTITLPPTTTTLPPTTTTLPPTTTTAAPTSTTSTTTTTTTAAPTATTQPPTTTTVPPTSPPPTTAAPTTTVAPVIEIERYTARDALLALANDDDFTPSASPQVQVETRGPVTKIMASLTTTAITVRSHLLSAMALGLLIAVAAVWGLGKRETAA